MELNNGLYLSFAVGALLPLALSAVLLFYYVQRKVHGLLVLAALSSVGWHIAYAGYSQLQFLSLYPLQLVEILRYGLWISALLVTIEFNGERVLGRVFRRCMHSSWLVSLIVVMVLSMVDSQAGMDTRLSVFHAWVLTILGILAAEQLCRTLRASRMTKLLGLGIGALFLYDAVLYTYMLIFLHLDPDYWQARGLVSSVVAVFVFVTVILFVRQPGQPSAFALSRSAVFYSASLTLAGCFILLMSLAGFYVRLFGGSWGGALQILVYFMSLVLMLLLSLSGKFRRSLNVWTNKHFFGQKYDYRKEWMRLNSKLNQWQHEEDCYQRASRALIAMFNASAGGLWLKEGAAYRPAALCGLTAAEEPWHEPAGSEFCQALERHEWVFMPAAPPTLSSGRFNDSLPPWMSSVDELWLVIPLLTDDELLGFVLLTGGRQQSEVSWEDLDLMKMVGRQVASYLGHQQSAQQLAEAQRFDAFNKLMAFAMHDLSNLIAKQALVVKNAEKHKDNPEFIEDVIDTVNNSVAKMSALLQKLQQKDILSAHTGEPDELLVGEVVREAVTRCHRQKPVPRLVCDGPELMLRAERESFVMMLSHLIKNAQDATPEHGMVDIRLSSRGHWLVIDIVDNGKGMSAAFLQQRLFKPFDSTKGGGGLGIGAYQIKHLVNSLNGNIEVQSAPGSGTTFRLLIPARQVA